MQFDMPRLAARNVNGVNKSHRSRFHAAFLPDFSIRRQFKPLPRRGKAACGAAHDIRGVAPGELPLKKGDCPWFF
jgi:hypothetical protein